MPSWWALSEREFETCGIAKSFSGAGSSLFACFFFFSGCFCYQGALRSSEISVSVLVMGPRGDGGVWIDDASRCGNVIMFGLGTIAGSCSEVKYWPCIWIKNKQAADAMIEHQTAPNVLLALRGTSIPVHLQNSVAHSLLDQGMEH